MSKTACFHYNTDSWVDVTSVTFKSKKVHEDNIFDPQDILQFFSEVSRDIPKEIPKHEIGTLIVIFILVFIFIVILILIFIFTLILS